MPRSSVITHVTRTRRARGTAAARTGAQARQPLPVAVDTTLIVAEPSRFLSCSFHVRAHTVQTRKRRECNRTAFDSGKRTLELPNHNCNLANLQKYGPIFCTVVGRYRRCPLPSACACACCGCGRGCAAVVCVQSCVCAGRTCPAVRQWWLGLAAVERLLTADNPPIMQSIPVAYLPNTRRHRDHMAASWQTTVTADGLCRTCQSPRWPFIQTSAYQFALCTFTSHGAAGIRQCVPRMDIGICMEVLW